MKIARAVLAIFLCAAFIQLANASTFFLGSVGKSFNETLSFNVSTVSKFEGGVVKINIPNLSYFLKDTNSNSVLASGGLNHFINSFQSLTLAAGSYSLGFAGFTRHGFGGYLGAICVAPVPEADTWVMLLVGSGLIAYQLRRKQRKLEQSFGAAA